MKARCQRSFFGMDESYFLWLCSLVDHDPEKDYSELLKELHSIEFSEQTAKLIPNDHNRISDGLDLRDRFCKDEDVPYSEWMDEPCTFLEMLIGLSYRMEDTMGGDYDSWFWVIIENLDLDGMSNEAYSDLGDSKRMIDEIISDVLKRKYSKDGSGGLFPLKEPDKDQRKVEIWYQMSAYLVENYL